MLNIIHYIIILAYNKHHFIKTISLQDMWFANNFSNFKNVASLLVL